MVNRRWVDASGLKTLISKKARCPSLPQKFFAKTSRRATSSLLVVQWCGCFPVTGWRDGSVAILWHTSLKRTAMISLISLWCIDGNPPCLQLSALFGSVSFTTDTPRRNDNQFCQQVTAGASLSWGDLNPSLMAGTVLGASRDGTRWMIPAISQAYGVSKCSFVKGEAMLRYLGGLRAILRSLSQHPIPALT